MAETKKRTRPKKTEFEKKLERTILLAMRYGVACIKVDGEFEVILKPSQITQSNTPPKDKVKVNAAGIEINGQVPKEELEPEEDMLFWSTPTYQMDKELMNGEALEKANQ